VVWDLFPQTQYRKLSDQSTGLELLSPRLTAGQLPLKEFIEVRILGGQLKNFFLKKFGKWKTLSYLCIVIEGKGGRVSSLTLWKPKK
jgi:hypothetical protein